MKDVEKSCDKQEKDVQPGGLVRSMESSEYVCALMGMKFKNDFNTVKLVWLESDEPIDPEKVRRVITLIAESIFILQLCIEKQWIKMSFKRMKKLIIDFDSTDDDYMKMYEYLMETTYDFENGPLWKVRFIKSVKSETSGRYTSVIGYGIQHCISDGPTSLTIIRETIRLLNAVIKGEEPVPIVKEMTPPIKPPFPSLSFLLKTIWTDLYEAGFKNFLARTTFGYLLPTPVAKPPGTKLLLADLNGEETSRMITKCKEEKVTIHSLISACCNFAFLSLAQKRTTEDIGQHVMKVAHCVNGRRYLGQRYNEACGCLFLLQPIRTTNSLKQNVWDAARQLQTVLKGKVDEEKEPLKLLVLAELNLLAYPINSFLSWRSQPHRTQYHYSTTNMGDLKHHLPDPEPGDPVEVSYIVRSVKNVYGSVPFIVTFHTFRGRFLLSLDCFTAKFPPILGEEYLDILMSCIRQFTNTGNINLMAEIK